MLEKDGRNPRNILSLFPAASFLSNAGTWHHLWKFPSKSCVPTSKTEHYIQNDQLGPICMLLFEHGMTSRMYLSMFDWYQLHVHLCVYLDHLGLRPLNLILPKLGLLTHVEWNSPSSMTASFFQGIFVQMRLGPPLFSMHNNINKPNMQIEKWDHGYPFVKMLKSCARGPSLANVGKNKGGPRLPSVWHLLP